MEQHRKHKVCVCVFSEESNEEDLSRCHLFWRANSIKEGHFKSLSLTIKI